MANQIDVDIQIDVEIFDETGKETIRKKEKGVYLHKNNIHVIKYDEQMDDFGPVKTTLMIQKNKIVLKREGIVKLHQTFRIGKKTEALYTHPYGQFRMETVTRRIEFFKGINLKSGRFFADYDVRLNDQDARRHTLQVKFQEEE